MLGLNVKEWAIAGVTAVAVLSLYGIRTIWNKQGEQPPDFDMSYEMPRPNQDFYSYSRYSLNDRGFKTPVEEAEAVENKGLPASQMELKKNKKQAAPKKKDLKKAQVQAKKKKAEEAKKKAVAEARKKFELNMINTRRERQAQRERDEAARAAQQNYNQQQNYAWAAAYAPVANSSPGSDKSKSKEDEEKLSPSQWFSLLQSQPTRAHAAKFIKAKSYLGIKDYYEIVTKLLKDSQEVRQNLAFYVLSQDVTLETYSYLAKVPEDIRKIESIAVKLTVLFKTYTAKERFSILAQAMASKDNQLVIVAQTQLLGILKNRGGATVGGATNPDDNVSSASGGSSTNSTAIKDSDLNIFRTVVTETMKSMDSTVAQNAKELYSALWQGASVADTGQF